MAELMLREILSFLPWCWLVNMSFSMLGFFSRVYVPLASIDRPLDARVSLPDAQRLLGDSTTWGGLLLASTLGLIGEYLVPGSYLLSIALCTYLGHALGSFLKRRLRMPRGSYAPFIDHGDYVLVTGGALLAFGVLSLPSVLVAYLFTVAFTPLVTVAAFALRFRTRPL